jgi:hypothetical protein
MLNVKLNVDMLTNFGESNELDVCIKRGALSKYMYRAAEVPPFQEDAPDWLHPWHRFGESKVQAIVPGAGATERGGGEIGGSGTGGM